MGNEPKPHRTESDVDGLAAQARRGLAPVPQPDAPERQQRRDSGPPDFQNPARTPNFLVLERALVAIAAEARMYAGTERGERAFERLVFILKKSALRMARAYLEVLLPPESIDPADEDEVADSGFIQLYISIGEYKSDTPVIPWFAEMVLGQARAFLRGEHHSRSRSGEISAPDDSEF